MSKMSTSSMRMTPKRGYVGVCAVIGLMLLTIYMAFAFPFTLFQLKQTETTEIKSVIIIGREGEISPTPKSYFMGEEPPEELNAVGFEQLTNVGKERMYLLGKFLKLKYYQLLLNGNPRMLRVRSADLDRTLESAQALLAGLNPPKDGWLWSSTDLKDWQPKAIHTTSAAGDDLLSITPNCYRLNQDRLKWKNSTRYQQLLNEFRHDLQTLRANTGLEFEDDLEIVSQIEDSLRTRQAFKLADVPVWYTPTFADRLAHIADVTTGSRYNSVDMQRLYVGRLLGEIMENVDNRIGLDLELMAAEENRELQDDKPRQQTSRQSSTATKMKSTQDEPKIFIYLTDKQRLAALLQSLKIYTSQPQFGSLLLIELHYDPINHLHLLRLFTVSSTSPNVLPEPLRVNPIACVDSLECSPQQFEQNIRHLMLDRAGWQDACNSQPPTTTVSTQPSWPIVINNSSSIGQQPQATTPEDDPQAASTQLPPTSSSTSQSPPSILTDSFVTSSEPTITTTGSNEKLDADLLVGSTSVNNVEPSSELKQENVTKAGMVEATTSISISGASMSSVSMDPSSKDEHQTTGEPTKLRRDPREFLEASDGENQSQVPDRQFSLMV